MPSNSDVQEIEGLQKIKVIGNQDRNRYKETTIAEVKVGVIGCPVGTKSGAVAMEGRDTEVVGTTYETAMKMGRRQGGARETESAREGTRHGEPFKWAELLPAIGRG